MIRRQGARGLSLIPTGAGEGRELPQTGFEAYSAAFFPDGKRLLLGGQALGRSGRLYTGRREIWKELEPADPAGVTYVRPYLTRDGRAYVYTCYRYLSDLYLVTGLR